MTTRIICFTFIISYCAFANAFPEQKCFSYDPYLANLYAEKWCDDRNADEYISYQEGSLPESRK